MDTTLTGANVLSYRRALELTQTQLARALGVTVRTIRRVETGHTQPRGSDWASWGAFVAHPAIVAALAARKVGTPATSPATADVHHRVSSK